MDLTQAAGVRRLDGTRRYDTAGWALAGAGDLDGDGVADLAVGVPRTDVVREQSGSVFLVSGRRLRR